MWTPIRSRARTALTVGAVLLTVALVVAALLFVVQRAFPSQTHTYQSYQLEVTPSSPWHVGQSLSLVWVPNTAQIGPDAPPRSVTCQFSLYGPYATQAAAQADQHEAGQGNGTLAASAPSLTLSTDQAAPAPTPVAYTLPNALAPGYYVAVGTVGAGDTSATGGSSAAWVAEVTA
jgi:hypothetical protein